MNTWTSQGTDKKGLCQQFHQVHMDMLVDRSTYVDECSTDHNLELEECWVRMGRPCWQLGWWEVWCKVFKSVQRCALRYTRSWSSTVYIWHHLCTNVNGMHASAFDCFLVRGGTPPFLPRPFGIVAVTRAVTFGLFFFFLTAKVNSCSDVSNSYWVRANS